MPQIGKMKHCIMFQKPKRLAEKRLADGGVQDTYDDYKEVWAEFNPKRGREVWTADAQEGQQFLRFRIWFDEDVTVDTRAIYKEKIYNCKTVMNEDGMDVFMLIEMTLAENRKPGDA